MCLARTLFQTDLGDAVVSNVRSDLRKIKTFLEPEVTQFLQDKVKIWIEKNLPQFPSGVYHYDKNYLINKNLPLYWNDSVQMGNASNYLKWKNYQPAVLFHELAHAWHH